MKQELEDKFYFRFPEFFEHQIAFECGDGWYDLLYDLFSKLEDIAPIIVIQIKEKFGGLRFYTGPATDEHYKLITEAENQSYHICEVCGKEGKVRTGGWVVTLCDKHYEERERDRL
jgi:hypothetical protein